MAETSRDLFASRLGMLAATLGSSVGLGNIWKFPALTGEHGGASFLLVYILSTLVVGLPLMIAELLTAVRRAPMRIRLSRRCPRTGFGGLSADWALPVR